MLETCLENKVIYNFLSFYEKTCWKKLIPSLLEIAILNLKLSFNTLFFSEEDIHNIIKDLKIKQKNDFNPIANKKEKLNFSKPLIVWRSADIWGEKEPFENYRYSQSLRKNKEKYNKNFASSLKNKMIYPIDFDKNSTFNKSDNIDNKLSQTYNQREKINYAISYDKDLNPEIIERTTVKKNKNQKGGKKIIQKMTQEEYEQQYSEENPDNNNEIIYENEENSKKEKNIHKNIKDKKLLNRKNFNANQQKAENKNKQKPNKLYHYKNNINNENNINFINNKNLNDNKNKNIVTNMNKILNSQNGFDNQFFKIQNKLINNNLINTKSNNNYINIENNENDELNNEKSKNYFNRNINQEINILAPSIKDSGKTTDLIGIEKKYKNKIDELEKNILQNNIENNLAKNTNNKNNIYGNKNLNFDFNKNNIENYSDKLKVNITNMEDYRNQKGINVNSNDNNEQNNNLEINIINNDNEEVNNEAEEEEIEEEENNENENNLNENDNEEGDYLSQMSNMTEKGKFLFKKAMDECPSTEEDNFDPGNIEENLEQN